MGRTLADFSSNEKLTPYLAELAGQSDRACGIVAAAMLETLLEQILRKRFVPGTSDDLFVTYGPLSTFSAKVNACAALGLITASERRELHTIRRIRNDFAHDLHKSSFDQDPIGSHVKQLSLSRSELIGRATSSRRDFEAAVMVLLGFHVVAPQGCETN
jgi:DNA-binding MltR family transcriptional regulator